MDISSLMPLLSLMQSRGSNKQPDIGHFLPLLLAGNSQFKNNPQLLSLLGGNFSNLNPEKSPIENMMHIFNQFQKKPEPFVQPTTSAFKNYTRLE